MVNRLISSLKLTHLSPWMYQWLSLFHLNRYIESIYALGIPLASLHWEANNCWATGERVGTCGESKYNKFKSFLIVT